MDGYMKIIIVSMSLFLSACGSFITIHDANNVPLSTLTKAQNLSVISQEQGKQMIMMGNVKGHSCKNQSFDPSATKVGAENQVKISAVLAGADAISIPACTNTGFSFFKNCWDSWECTAMVYIEKK